MGEAATHSVRREALRTMFAKSDDPYAGADVMNARRILALLWLLSSALTLAFLAFDPPTGAIGRIGWLPAAAVVVAGLLGPRQLLGQQRGLGFHGLLVLSYLGLAQVGLLQWLAGGAGTPYHNLILFWVVPAMGTHPPRRALPLVPAALLAAALPLLYGGWDPHTASEIVTDALVWVALGTVVMSLMTYVRTQRLMMTRDEEQAQELARADTLTGLPNRRAFDEALATETARTRRSGSPLAVCVLDIDGFKRINDGYGHLQGDRCLREVAHAISGELRAAERCFRWGGDEFVLVLPETSQKEADKAGGRLVSRVRDACCAPDGRPLEITFGTAERGSDMEPAELLDRADLALLGKKMEASGGTQSGRSAAGPFSVGRGAPHRH